jgi:hypothetical protein
MASRLAVAGLVGVAFAVAFMAFKGEAQPAPAARPAATPEAFRPSGSAPAIAQLADTGKPPALVKPRPKPRSGGGDTGTGDGDGSGNGTTNPGPTPTSAPPAPTAQPTTAPPKPTSTPPPPE